jgi:hypothetical protein
MKDTIVHEKVATALDLLYGISDIVPEEWDTEFDESLENLQYLYDKSKGD